MGSRTETSPALPQRTRINVHAPSTKAGDEGWSARRTSTWCALVRERRFGVVCGGRRKEIWWGKHRLQRRSIAVCALVFSHRRKMDEMELLSAMKDWDIPVVLA